MSPSDSHLAKCEWFTTPAVQRSVKSETLNTKTNRSVKPVSQEILAENHTFEALSRAHATTHMVVVKPNRQLDERKVQLTDGATKLSVKRLGATSERIDLSSDAEKVNKFEFAPVEDKIDNWGNSSCTARKRESNRWNWNDGHHRNTKWQDH
jgi:hypothetical protein